MVAIGFSGSGGYHDISYFRFSLIVIALLWREYLSVGHRIPLFLQGKKYIFVTQEQQRKKKVLIMKKRINTQHER